MASKRVKRLLKEAFVSADGDTVTIATSRFLALLDAEKRLAAGRPQPAPDRHGGAGGAEQGQEAPPADRARTGDDVTGAGRRWGGGAHGTATSWVGRSAAHASTRASSTWATSSTLLYRSSPDERPGASWVTWCRVWGTAKAR